MTVAYFDSSALVKAAWDTFRQALRLVEVAPQLEEDAGDLAERLHLTVCNDIVVDTLKDLEPAR